MCGAVVGVGSARLCAAERNPTRDLPMRTTDRQTPPPEGHVRPLDPFHDLEPVVDLISVAFGERLDPAGKATLARMRRFAHSGPLLQWARVLMGRATVTAGLVWVVNGRVVGNVSVRRARSSGGYLIGNVVVHPEWRGRGIASALMRKAIRVVSRRRAHWVGLEVRVGNEVARGLYERLGFQEVGRTHHLLRPAGTGQADQLARPDLMRRGRRRDGDALVQLMRAVIPEEQRPLLDVKRTDYHPSWGRRLEHWLRCEDEVWWVVPMEDPGEDGIIGAVRAVHRRGAFPNCMEVLVHPGKGPSVESDLVRRGVASLRGSPRKPIEISLPRATGALLLALDEEGFQKLRVLIQMRRSLRQEIAVPVKP